MRFIISFPKYNPFSEFLNIINVALTIDLLQMILKKKSTISVY